MQDKNESRIYALVYSAGPGAPEDLAALHAAAALGRQAAGETCALILCAASQMPACTQAAKNAGIDSVAIAALPDGNAPLQPHQIAAAFHGTFGELEGRMQNEGGRAARSIIVVGAGTIVEEAAGDIAARLDALPLGRPLRMECDTEGNLSFIRGAFGGRLEITQRLNAARFLVALRHTEANAADATNPAREKELTALDMICPPLPTAHPMTAEAQTETEVNLDGARMVVSGGRGMGGDRGFELLRELARRLDAAVAGSLPAVDAGWTPVSRQVGQSGKYVSPAVYLAVGISGTPQHLAGIDPHTRIFAINSDPEAPIFGVASVGVVAPWEEFLPPLLEALSANA